MGMAPYELELTIHPREGRTLDHGPIAANLPDAWRGYATVETDGLGDVVIRADIWPDDEQELNAWARAASGRDDVRRVDVHIHDAENSPYDTWEKRYAGGRLTADLLELQETLVATDLDEHVRRGWASLYGSKDEQHDALLDLLRAIDPDRADDRGAGFRR